MLLQTILIIVSANFSVYFFWKSAGSLHLGKINIVSASFYLFFLQNFLGAALIQWGLNKHYTLDNLINRNSSIDAAFYMILISAVMWPLAIYLFLRFFRVRPAKDYDDYLKKPVSVINERQVFWYIAIFGAVCLILLAVYLFKIGYVPLWRLFSRPENFDFRVERMIINKTVLINPIVRNVLVLLAIPLLSYAAFAFSLSVKKMRWFILAALFFAAAIVTKTYNFEKSPIIFHLAIYLLIYIYYKGGIKSTIMMVFGGVGIGLLSVFYLIIMGNRSIGLYEGIIGRTIFTPFGAFSYNFDMFPGIYDFLGGRSAAATILKLVGVDPDLHLRSARLLMEFYGSKSVYSGTGGVMNTVFMGEAYANFGWVGLVFSLVWVGFVIACLFTLIMKIRKTPLTVTLAAYMTISIATTTQGGFFDFLYNFIWIFAIGSLLFFEYLPDITEKIRIKSGAKK